MTEKDRSAYFSALDSWLLKHWSSYASFALMLQESTTGHNRHAICGRLVMLINTSIHTRLNDMRYYFPSYIKFISIFSWVADESSELWLWKAENMPIPPNASEDFDARKKLVTLDTLSFEIFSFKFDCKPSDWFHVLMWNLLNVDGIRYSNLRRSKFVQCLIWIFGWIIIWNITLCTW